MLEKALSLRKKIIPLYLGMVIASIIIVILVMKSITASIITAACILVLFLIFIDFKKILAIVAFSPLVSQIFKLDLRKAGLLTGLILIACFVISNIHSIIHRMSWKLGKDSLSLVFIALIYVLSAFFGLILGNNIVWLIGDLYQGLVIPMAFFTVERTVRKKSDIIWIINIVVIALLFEMMINMLPLLKEGNRINALLSGHIHIANPSGMLLFPIIWTFWRDNKNFARKIVYLIILIIDILYIILTLTRTYWLGVIISIIIYYTLFSHNDISVRKVLLHAFRNILLASIILFGIWRAMHWSTKLFSDYSLPTVIMDRVKQIYQDRLDPSITGRIVESQGALKKALQAPFFGWGQGATFENPRVEIPGTSFTDSPHFIHNTYVAIFFRTGILGLLSFLITIVIFIYVGMKGLNIVLDKTSHTVLKAIIVANLTLLVLSWGAQYYVGNVCLGMLLGCQSVMISQSRTKYML